MVKRQPDMEVIGEVLDPIELLLAARATKVDVVIVTPLDSEDKPEICTHLLDEHPQLKIVTLSAKNDDAAFLYKAGASKQRIDEPSEQSILGAIRESMHPITD
jgi:DNA-binding NarL/FixJ family response regulator